MEHIEVKALTLNLSGPIALPQASSQSMSLRPYSLPPLPYSVHTPLSTPQPTPIRPSLQPLIIPPSTLSISPSLISLLPLTPLSSPYVSSEPATYTFKVSFSTVSSSRLHVIDTNFDPTLEENKCFPLARGDIAATIAFTENERLLADKAVYPATLEEFEVAVSNFFLLSGCLSDIIRSSKNSSKTERN